MNISKPIEYAYYTTLSESATDPEKFDSIIRSQIPTDITDRLKELGFEDGTMVTDTFYEMRFTTGPLTMVATITCDEYIVGDPIFIKVEQDPECLINIPADALTLRNAWEKVYEVWTSIAEINANYR